MIRTLIVDDQNIIREGIKVLLEDSTEIEIVGFAEDGETAIEKIEANKPNVVLLDINLPGIDGLTVANQIGEKFPSVKVIMLSSCEDESSVRKAVTSSAKGYLLKDVSAEELEWSIKLVHQGYSSFKSKLIESLGKSNRNGAIATKSQVELEVVPLQNSATTSTTFKKQNSRELEMLLAKNQVRKKYSDMKQQRRGLAFHSVNISRTKKTIMSFEFKLLVFIILFSLGFLVFVALS